uniref:Ribonuclease Z n=1 Tax=Scinaia undulata TaxID=1884664 RepID=A0A1G4NX89_9FLOR|nr:Ribonuclease Z [Scinaia undulata]SCW23301.1 Ribonuclease Z [Scinaia undulata]
MGNNSPSFLVKCSQTSRVWLFNCPEGCQHTLMKKQIKLHQINNIIFTNLDNRNTAGIMGLLSSLSLNCSLQQINIYGPPGTLQYLQLLRKYSQTTFRYILKIHTINYGYLNFNPSYAIQAYPSDVYKHTFEYSFTEKEKIGRFQSDKAISYKINKGPMYGYLKYQNKCIMPDGLIVSGDNFTHQHSMGLKISLLNTRRISRLHNEVISELTHVIFSSKKNM